MMLRNFFVTPIALCAAGAVACRAHLHRRGSSPMQPRQQRLCQPRDGARRQRVGLGAWPGKVRARRRTGGRARWHRLSRDDRGQAIALHADGSPFWSRDIMPGQAIVASPAIASDGSVYVIGVGIERKPADARVASATLHHFNSTGAWLNQIAFPHTATFGRCTQPAEHLAIRQRRSNHGPGSLSQQGHRRTFGQTDRLLTHGPGAR